MKEKNHKLGIIVPYRKRPAQLSIFIEWISKYLTDKNIDFVIIIVEQDNAKQFNRGSLLNIGFKHARRLRCDYVAFHDVDLLPIDVNYEYTDVPIHLATGFVDDEIEIFDEYFGGVTLFPVEDFLKIDGYSNKYWGWGYEDTDLLFRCGLNNIPLDELKIKNMGRTKTALKFNGMDAFITGRNIFDIDYNTTFFISFYPDDILCDPTKDVDYYTIFSIPGYDTSISYNSFLRYNFCTFDENRNAIYLNSKIKTNYKTDICVVFDNNIKEIRLYQDGIFIGKIPIQKQLLSYSYERFFYIGAGQPTRTGDERFFKGYFTSFAGFSDVLSDKEIYEISKTGKPLNNNFGDYKSSDKLLIYYDTDNIHSYKLTDLSGNGYNGKINRCEIVNLNIDENKTVLVPYRRKSLFKAQSKGESGYYNNQWKSKLTRWNQLRFHNEIRLNPELTKNDGLSNVWYIQHEIKKDGNVRKVIVGL